MSLFKEKLRTFLERYGITPKSYQYYELAFFYLDIKTKKKKNKKDNEIKWNNNQRLEYFGDTIYLFCINSYLFDLRINKNSNILTDNQMSNAKDYFISGKFQVKIAKWLELDKLIILQNEIQLLDINDKMLEDVFEAFICAIYLDQNLSKTQDFINEIIFNNYPIIINKELCKVYKEVPSVIKSNNLDTKTNSKNTNSNTLKKDSDNVKIKEQLNQINFLTNDEIKRVVEIIYSSSNKSYKTSLQEICQLIANKKEIKKTSYKNIVQFKNGTIYIDEQKFKSGKTKEEAIKKTIENQLVLLLSCLNKKIN